jgi:C1A family cysteine protease
MSKYTLAEDRIDWRDRYYKPADTSIRESVDFRLAASGIEQQSDLGSCTSQAIVGAFELILKRDYPESFVELSRLFLYYNTRLQDSNINEDVGAYPRDALKVAKRYGICTEKLWPYDISKFRIRPTPECYRDGLSRTIDQYHRLSSLNDVLGALNAEEPVIAGIDVFDSFEQITPSDPVLEMPGPDEEPIGAHAVLFVGYDLEKRQILVRNSFGPTWGDGGYFWIPFDYCANYLTDAWTIKIKLKKT